MGFPSVAAADTKTGNVVANSTTWVITYCTNIAAGDLLLLFISADGTNSGGTLPAGWLGGGGGVFNGASTIRLGKKKAVGTETGTFNVTMPSEQGTWRMIRIPAAQWEGTIGPTDFANTVNSGSVVTGSTPVGTDAAPNPPSLDPNNWVSEDTLWIAYGATDGSVTFNTFPANYTQEDHATAGGISQVSGGAGGAGLGIAYRKLNASSEDPGAFGLSGSEDWGAMTIGIRGTPVTPPTPPTQDAGMFIGNVT